MSEIITTKDKVANGIFNDMQEKRATEKSNSQIIKDNWVNLRDRGFGIAERLPDPAILDYDEGRMFYDVFPDGEWKDQRCFIIGGGESLKDFDFSKLKNELVIGVNRAFEMIDCQVNFAMDHNLYEWLKSGKLGPEATKKFENYRGHAVWLDTVGYDYPPGVFILPGSKGSGLSSSLKEGIVTCTNSGFGALNLAICLGANPIYLLGFDMKSRDEKQSWWHDGYPNTQGSKIYKTFINDFNRIVPALKERKINVINLNSESALKCFEFEKFEDIKPIDRPIFASYYTKNTGYEKQVEELKTTLRRFNLENDIRGIKDLGDWYKNTYIKSLFVVQTMKRHPDRSIVFVDADAKIRRSPVLFNDYDYDFAFHNYNKKELLAGTLYFKNSKGGRYMADQWLKIDREKLTTLMPQKNLHAVFNKVKDKIKWDMFPIEYCMIFDCRARGRVRPVVEHFQLSRKYKDIRQKQPGYRLRGGLAKIQRLCKDKNMCIIGNADSVLKTKKEIDSFDIIGRMNRGKPQGKEEFIGSRTDILFLSTGLSRKSMELAYGLCSTIWMTENHRLAHPWVLRNGVQNPVKDWRELHKKLGINPTTGMMTLKFCLKYLEFKTLTIYGYDFFKTKSWYNTKVDSGQKHSGDKERVLFMKMIKGRKDVRFIQ